MSINSVFMSGNLTREPEVRATASGLQVLGFGMAVEDRRQNKQTGEWESHPNFVDCTLFGARAGKLAQWLHKGSKVVVAGKLRYNQWQAQDGSKRSKLEVVVDEIEIMVPPSNAQQAPQMAPAAPQAMQPQQAPQMQPAAPQQMQPTTYDEQIPF